MTTEAMAAGGVPLTAAEIHEVQGFFGDLRNGIEALRSPIVQKIFKLIAALSTPDRQDDKDAIKEILILKGIPTELVDPIYDFVVGMLDQFSQVKELIPDAPIRVSAAVESVELNTGARKHIRDMTVAECETWFAERKGSIRDASKTPGVARVLRKRCPEVLAALDGTATTAQLAALSPEQIIKGLNIAIMVCTVVAAFYPPVGLLVTVLKMVLARYESSNPDVGMAMSDLL